MKPSKGRIVIHRNRPQNQNEPDGDWPAIVVAVNDKAVTLRVFALSETYTVVTPIEPINVTDDFAGWFWPPREN